MKKDKKLLQAKIQALVVELLQVLDGQPLVHGLMALDTAKQIIQQEIETKSKTEDKTKWLQKKNLMILFLKI